MRHLHQIRTNNLETDYVSISFISTSTISCWMRLVERNPCSSCVWIRNKVHVARISELADFMMDDTPAHCKWRRHENLWKKKLYEEKKIYIRTAPIAVPYKDMFLLVEVAALLIVMWFAHLMHLLIAALFQLGLLTGNSTGTSPRTRLNVCLKRLEQRGRGDWREWETWYKWNLWMHRQSEYHILCGAGTRPRQNPKIWP